MVETSSNIKLEENIFVFFVPQTKLLSFFPPIPIWHAYLSLKFLIYPSCTTQILINPSSQSVFLKCKTCKCTLSLINHFYTSNPTGD